MLNMAMSVVASGGPLGCNITDILAATSRCHTRTYVATGTGIGTAIFASKLTHK